MLGTVIEDPFIYILGGATGTGTTTTASAERTVW
jgi:2-phosphoglycerate kinase